MNKSWDHHIKGFKIYLSLEKSLSENSVKAYLHDIIKLVQYFEVMGEVPVPENVKPLHIKNFIQWINSFGVSSRSQARMISGLKAFFKA